MCSSVAQSVGLSRTSPSLKVERNLRRFVSLFVNRATGTIFEWSCLFAEDTRTTQSQYIQGSICQISLGGGVEVLAIEVDDRANA